MGWTSPVFGAKFSSTRREPKAWRPFFCFSKSGITNALCNRIFLFSPNINKKELFLISRRMDGNQTWAPLRPVLRNETGRLSSVYDCVTSNASGSMYTPICSTYVSSILQVICFFWLFSSVVLLSLSLLTLVVGILSAIRIVLVSKRTCTVHLNMNLFSMIILF